VLTATVGCAIQETGSDQGVIVDAFLSLIFAAQEAAAAQQPAADPVSGAFALGAVAVSSIGAAVASVAAVLQIQAMTKGIQLQDQDGRVSVLLDVMNRWSNTLPSLYAIRERSSECATAEASYEHVTDFMLSDHWAKLRVVCNFYEFVGLLAFNKVLRLETLLVIITVRPSDYQLAKASIDRLRRDYRKDIYLFWDWLDIQCNHGADLPRAMKEKRLELEALDARWAQGGAGPSPSLRSGLNPFATSAKPGL
jgi:hypothetical protein